MNRFKGLIIFIIKTLNKRKIFLSERTVMFLYKNKLAQFIDGSTRIEYNQRKIPRFRYVRRFDIEEATRDRATIYIISSTYERNLVPIVRKSKNNNFNNVFLIKNGLNRAFVRKLKLISKLPQ